MQGFTKLRIKSEVIIFKIHVDICLYMIKTMPKGRNIVNVCIVTSSAKEYPC